MSPPHARPQTAAHAGAAPADEGRSWRADGGGTKEVCSGCHSTRPAEADAGRLPGEARACMPPSDADDCVTGTPPDRMECLDHRGSVSAGGSGCSCTEARPPLFRSRHRAAVSERRGGRRGSCPIAIAATDAAQRLSPLAHHARDLLPTRPCLSTAALRCRARRPRAECARRPRTAVWARARRPRAALVMRRAAGGEQGRGEEDDSLGFRSQLSDVAARSCVHCS